MTVNLDAVPRWLRPAVVRLVLMLVVFFGVNALVSLVLNAVAGAPVGREVLGVTFAGLALLLYAGMVKFTERRPVAELREVSRLFRGAGLGVVLFVAVIALIAVFGGYRVTGWGSVGGAIGWLGLMCGFSVVEELVFRGVLLRILSQLTGTYVALGISAVVFGGLHLVNPDATVWGALAIAVEAGLMLGSAYVYSGSLWLPIGLHLGWNFAEAGLFGTVVSGSSGGPQGLLRSTMPGSTVLTGGEFGPEASIVAILVCAVPTVLFLRAARTRRRGEV